MSDSTVPLPSSLAYGAIIDTVLAAYGERPALAERAYVVQVDPATGITRRQILAEFRPITYRTLRDRVRCLATAWCSDPDGVIRRGELVAIIGFASIDYAVIDLALAYTGAVPMPLSGHHSGPEFDAILEQATPAALAVSIAQLPAMVDLVRRHVCIKQLIVFDADTRITAERTLLEEAERTLRAAGSMVPVLLLADLIRHGQGDDVEVPPPAAVDVEAMALLIHTSGSTGQPKGACISAGALINTWRQVNGPFPKVAVVLAPFHHMMGRDSMVTALNSGGLACFTLKPDLSTVFEDIRLARPTALVLFPRLCEWIDQHVRSIQPADSLRVFLGDRLQSIVVASAPIAPRIRALMEDTFQVPVHEGYSSTETASGGLAMNGRLNRPNVLDYRLRDVPESGYFLSDRPYPRGELCVKTRFGIREYFKNPEATAELFDADGFCCTGDVVEERGPGQIAIIDRRKNVIKLSQGEYVAVGVLEQLFSDGCATVAQIHVHGESSRSYLLAVVVPDREALARRPQPPAAEADLIALVRQEVVQLASERGLQSFEIPRDFIIAAEPFSHANGLLSSLGKPIRPAIRQRYQRALAQLYDSHDSHGRAALATLRQPGTELSLEDRLRLLLSSTLGVQDHGALQDRCFRELGGDSLAAVQLSVRIEAEFGVAIEASQILGPGGTIEAWARILRDHLGRRPRIPPAGGADGSGQARELAAADLRVDAFIDGARLRAVAELPPASRPVSSVLLTGASGFLGGRVALAWLERLAITGGRLVCLVRPTRAQSARERLDARFAHLDPATAARWRTLAERHLEVVAGDISEPCLGLDADTYERLAHSIEAIGHCAALVNHRLDYRHLRRPNVIGTAEIVRLAMTHRRKSIDMISTIGVASLRERIRLDGSYANGYIASKWACEQLLRSTHTETGLPIRILRSGLVLPDRHLAGERNPDDILSRLIHSILLTGLAPPAFSVTGAAGEAAGFRASGLPVDQLAQAIVALGDFAPDGFHLFTLGGPSDGWFPLEALVDRIEAAGFPLERMASYGEWLARIEQALRQLPAAQRSLSLLDVLEAYRPARAPEVAEPGAEAFVCFLADHGGVDLKAGFPADYLGKVCSDVVAAA